MTSPGSFSAIEAPTVEIRYHGYPEVLRGGQLVPLKLKRGLALLAYLSEIDRKASRAQVAELLWPDAPLEVGRARLRRLCHEVNTVLGIEALVGDGDAIWLNTGNIGLYADVTNVRRAAAQLLEAPQAPESRVSLELICGPQAGQILSGFGFESDVFNDWLDGRRADFERLLTRALTVAADALLAQGQPALANDAATVLIQLDPLADAGHVIRLHALAQLGQGAALDAAYVAYAELLRNELGIRPSAQLEQAYAYAQKLLTRIPGDGEHGHRDLPKIHFMSTDDGMLAYLEVGEAGARCGTLVITFGLWSHVELSWEQPKIRSFLQRLSQRFHVILMDRRGVGLSERILERHSVEAGADDIEAIRTRLGVDRLWLFGNSLGGCIALEYAATRPEHVAGLLLFGTGARGTWAPDYPWGATREQLFKWEQLMHDRWGCATSLENFAPSLVSDPDARDWWARTLRQALSRNSLRAVLHAFAECDVRGRLPDVRSPTLVVQRKGDRIVRMGAAAFVAESIRGAELVALNGDDHLLWGGDSDAVFERLEQFVDQHATPGT